MTKLYVILYSESQGGNFFISRSIVVDKLEDIEKYIQNGRSCKIYETEGNLVELSADNLIMHIKDKINKEKGGDEVF